MHTVFVIYLSVSGEGVVPTSGEGQDHFQSKFGDSASKVGDF